MRVSLNWLRQFIELDDGVGAEEVAERLTMAGLEVEAIEDIGAPLKGFLVGRVVTREKHPDADRLSVCTVNAGGAALPVVCGAPNVDVGQLIAFAPVGVTLPDGTKIKKAKIRGQESQGMICSEKELGIGADASGILVIAEAEGVEAGMPLALALHRDDTVLEIGVTPNRPDALSHIGVAREAAAALRVRTRLKAPQCAERGGPVEALAHVTILAPDRCPRYGARVIEEVTIGPSPAWVVARLAACGVRSVNNVVDVTNLVMMERGIPLHAFDLDKIGKDRDRAEIVVRTASPGEKLKTLDDTDRVLTEDDLVIADPNGALAIAGVMGGASSEVTDATRRILLECAYFEPAGVRRTSKRTGLHSESSHRFERGCDPSGVPQSLDRAAALIADLAEGQVCRGSIDEYPRKIEPAMVSLRPARAARLMGLPERMLDEAECSKLLLQLGLEVAGREGEALRFRVPTYRPDLTREVDLIEELLRLVGYDQVEATLPARSGESGSVMNRDRKRVVDTIRSALCAAGFHEAINIAFVGPEDEERFGDGTPWVELQNPLGEEMSRMRGSLLPPLLRNAALNQRRGHSDVRLFEVGGVFLGKSPGGAAPTIDVEGGPAGADAWAVEASRISGVAIGEVGARAFDRPRASLDFYDVKGALEEVLDELGLPVSIGQGDVRVQVPETMPSWLHPGAAAELVLVDPPLRIGLLGELHPDLAGAYELKGAAIVFDLDADALATVASPLARARALPRFPAVRRDLALIVNDTLEADELCRTLLGAKGVRTLLEAVEVFDVYRGDHVPDGKKSVALSFVLRAADRTLTDDEVSDVATQLVDVAVKDLGAEIRA